MNIFVYNRFSLSISNIYSNGSSVIPGVGIARCGHIERKDLDIAG